MTIYIGRPISWPTLWASGNITRAIFFIIWRKLRYTLAINYSDFSICVTVYMLRSSLLNTGTSDNIINADKGSAAMSGGTTSFVSGQAMDRLDSKTIVSGLSNLSISCSYSSISKESGRFGQVFNRSISYISKFLKFIPWPNQLSKERATYERGRMIVYDIDQIIFNIAGYDKWNWMRWLSAMLFLSGYFRRYLYEEMGFYFKFKGVDIPDQYPWLVKFTENIDRDAKLSVSVSTICHNVSGGGLHHERLC